MNRVTIRTDRCKGCGLCIEACPKKILRFADTLNVEGVKPAEVFEPEKCIACAFCATMCPDCAIKVEKNVQKGRKINE